MIVRRRRRRQGELGSLLEEPAARDDTQVSRRGALLRVELRAERQRALPRARRSPRRAGRDRAARRRWTACCARAPLSAGARPRRPPPPWPSLASFGSATASVRKCASVDHQHRVAEADRRAEVGVIGDGALERGLAGRLEADDGRRPARNLPARARRRHRSSRRGS